MPYVDKEYYLNEYGGEPVNESDFPGLRSRAEEIVEEMTRYRVTPISFLALPEHIQEAVKKAVCAQLEYLDANGWSDLDNGCDLQSATLGKFNYSRASSGTGSTQQSIYSPRARRILMPTGLLYRGGGCP